MHIYAEFDLHVATIIYDNNTEYVAINSAHMQHTCGYVGLHTGVRRICIDEYRSLVRNVTVS